MSMVAKRFGAVLWRYRTVAARLAELHGGSARAMLLRMLRCRARTGFGCRDFALYEFHDRTPNEQRDYLFDRELWDMQVRVNSAEARASLDDKYEFWQRCVGADLPTPTVLARLDRETADPPTGERATPSVDGSKTLRAVLSRDGPSGRYLIKPARGWGGTGIMRVHHRRGGLFQDDGSELDVRALAARYSAAGDFGVVQRCLAPHDALSGLMPGEALGTFRIVTVGSDEGARVALAFARLPSAGNLTDNFSEGTSGNLLAGIDVATGELTGMFGPDPVVPGMIRRLDRHPVSGVPARGTRVPRWDALRSTALAGARAFDTLRTVGWDVALVADGPTLLEGNWRYGCSALQIAAGRGLGPELRRWLNVSTRVTAGASSGSTASRAPRVPRASSPRGGRPRAPLASAVGRQP